MERTLIPEGKKAKDFELKDENNKTHKLSDYKGQWVVVYFYPKDDTPGCTVEGIEFTALNKEFKKANTKVFGISADSTESHKKFCQKHDLGITLLSDPDRKVMLAYGGYGEKSLYGKIVTGVIRSTYIVDPEGKVAKVWKTVRSKGHAQKVLEAVQKFQEQ